MFQLKLSLQVLWSMSASQNQYFVVHNHNPRSLFQLRESHSLRAPARMVLFDVLCIRSLETLREVSRKKASGRSDVGDCLGRDSIVTIVAESPSIEA